MRPEAGIPSDDPSGRCTVSGGAATAVRSLMLRLRDDVGVDVLTAAVDRVHAATGVFRRHSTGGARVVSDMVNRKRVERERPARPTTLAGWKTRC
jgi:hypothetical protein